MGAENRAAQRGLKRVQQAATQFPLHVFGEVGRHARTAMALPASPMSTPVKVVAAFDGGDLA